MTAPGATRLSWRERVSRAIDVRPEETAAVAWSWLFYFCVLSAYYVIRPIRDDMGVEGGVENLPWLFTGSLAGMLILNPPFAWLVARWPRDRFVSAAYRFFALNLLIFFVLLRAESGGQAVWTGRFFFIWTSVFNMFVNAIFWSVMADVFSPVQGRRLFGFVAAGGTIGAIAGAGLTRGLVGTLGAANLLLVSAVLLEMAGFAARRLFRPARASGDGAAAPALSHPPELIGGSVWEGFARAVRSPYLLNITFHMLLFTVLTTFLYFQQATIVDATMIDRTERTRFFATIDLAVNLIELVTQLFATGPFMRVFGLTASLAFLPVLSVVGFACLGLSPTIAMLMVFQVLRRAGNFAIMRPAREVLFTLVSRADRYKAKSFIDTVVYRAGDQLGAWLYAPLTALGLGVPGISGIAVALALVSVGNAIWLGRRAHAAMREPVSASVTAYVP